MVVARDLNGHVGIDRAGYNNVHGGHGLDVVNEEGPYSIGFCNSIRDENNEYILPEAKKPSCDLQQWGTRKSN